MADENKEALMQPAFNPGYSAAYGPPPPMMAPPPTAPPQSYGAPGKQPSSCDSISLVC